MKGIYTAPFPGLVERAVSTPVPAPAVGTHPGYPKARIWEPVPPGQLFRAWSAVAHGLAHVARLRSHSGSSLDEAEVAVKAASQVAPLGTTWGPHAMPHTEQAARQRTGYVHEKHALSWDDF